MAETQKDFYAAAFAINDGHALIKAAIAPE
jgi:hypothetical protein